MATENKKPANAPAKAAEIPNTFTVKTRPEIVGLWGMEIPNNKKCIEYYNFKGNNNVVIKSGDEWTSGTGSFAADSSADSASKIRQ